MTITELNSLGYYLSSLCQMRNLGKFSCTVRPIKGFWFGNGVGNTIEEATTIAYEICRDMEMFGQTKRQLVKLNFRQEPEQKQFSLESLGLVKPLKRRSLNNG